MNRNEFMTSLRKELATLSDTDRNELMMDYEAHFTIGMQNGKTEEEIANELGNPQELAKQTLGYDGFLRPKAIQAVSMTRTTFSVIGLFFMNLMFILPVALTIWSGWLALSAAAVFGIVSPLLIIIDYILHPSFTGMKLFLSLVVSGLGIFVAIAAYYIFIALSKVTRAYLRWNYHVMMGGSQHG